MHVDTRTVTSVALALACVVAVAAAADGFESLSTDPEDMVDPEFDRLPVGESSLESLRDEVVSREGRGDVRPKPSDSGEDSSASNPGESEAQHEVTTQAEAESAAQTESAANQKQTTRSESSSDGSGSQPPPPDERNWRALLALLAALAVAAALVYRYADRFGSDDAESGPAFGDADPDSEVERAWLKLVRRVDADDPKTRTPGEWASAAVDAGLDADAVTTVTRAFESVRYGGDDETEERRRRVRRALDRLDARYGTDGGEPAERNEEAGR